jgi:3-dehydroquinate dehydratase I
MQAAARLKAGEVDVLEFRIDALADRLDAAERAMKAARFPVLLTVRRPDEGGATGTLEAGERKALYRRFLPCAGLIDVELRSLPAFGDIVQEARAAGCAVVVSNHDFKKTPSLKQLIDREKRAAAEGCDVFKIASVASTARELSTLLEFTARPAKWPRSVMGMGRFGRVSRLALAEAGSLLNYGYLHAANAPGQWEARELRRLIPRRLP